MKELPILFSGPMVRAILDGRKTQTRRAVKPQPFNRVVKVWQEKPGQRSVWCDVDCINPGVPLICKYAPGMTAWVRETWAWIPDDGGTYVYRATDPDLETIDGWKWRPSIFMPRAASRITLEIVSVRVQRVQEISDNDAKAEGIDTVRDEWSGQCQDFDETLSDRDLFRLLWDSINGKRPTAAWSDNPWVWVIEFKPL